MNWTESFAQDLRYGTRQLKQSPGFTLVALLSLALGIGANSAIFQLIDAVRLRTLPVQNPEELVTIDFPDGSTRSGWFSTRNSRFTYGQWEQIRARQQAFSGVLAWSATRFNLRSGGEARYAEGLMSAASSFVILESNPSLAARSMLRMIARLAPAQVPCSATDSGSANSPGTGKSLAEQSVWMATRFQ